MEDTQMELFSEAEMGGSTEQIEWCFQFFNAEPTIFAWTKEGTTPTNLVIDVEPSEDKGISFRKDGMTFSIFGRPITEEGKKLRDESNQLKKENTNELF